MNMVEKTFDFYFPGSSAGEGFALVDEQKGTQGVSPRFVEIDRTGRKILVVFSQVLRDLKRVFQRLNFQSRYDIHDGFEEKKVGATKHDCNYTCFFCKAKERDESYMFCPL